MEIEVKIIKSENVEDPNVIKQFMVFKLKLDYQRPINEIKEQIKEAFNKCLEKLDF